MASSLRESERTTNRRERISKLLLLVSKLMVVTIYVLAHYKTSALNLTQFNLKQRFNLANTWAQSSSKKDGGTHSLGVDIPSKS